MFFSNWPSIYAGLFGLNPETKCRLLVKSSRTDWLLLIMKISFFESLRKTIECNGIVILRIAVGILFFWFGFLKYFGNLSAAEDIAADTILWLTNDYVQPQVSMPILATLECIIGLGVLWKKATQYVLPLMYFHMAGTLLPLFVFPDKTWQIIPFVPTLEGQYIIKNAILVSAGIVLGAVSKGGKLIRNPEIAHHAKQAEESIDNG